MDKTDILNVVFKGYTKAFGKEFIEELKEKSASYRDKHLSVSDSEFINKLYYEIPELEKIERLYFKSIVENINRNLRTLATILIMFLIVGIVGALIFIMGGLAVYGA